MATKDLYALLGVARGASSEEIKQAYRKLARENHPDHNPGNKAAEERFKEISAAFAVLGDDKKRKLYDEFGPDGLREGFDPERARRFGGAGGGGGGGFGGFDFSGFEGLGGMGDLNDILSSILGGGMGGMGGGRRRPKRKGADVEGSVTIELKKALEGGELQLDSGVVRVPAGVADGQKLRLTGRGQPGEAGPGDLLLELKVVPPAGFEREGDDLTVDVPLKVSQAVLGDTVEVPTPEGTSLKLKIPAGMQTGRKLRVPERGMTTRGGKRGDLYLRAKVMVPKGDSDALKAAVLALDEFYA